MKVVYMGTADFAVPTLTAVADHVVMVVTQPDKPSGRGMEHRPSPVKVKATELGLRVESPVRCRAPEFVDLVRSLDADVLLVAAYGQILSAALLGAARNGGVNLHGSILPKYRGAAPIQRCLENGDLETGVTLMQMDVGMDTGDMIAVERTPIGPDETAGELFDRLAQLASRMAVEWLPRICTGNYPRTPQDETRATHAPKVTKEEAELRFTRSAKSEYDRFRAFTPSPGAFVTTRFGHVRLARARFAPESRSVPGVVLQTRPELVLGFNGGAISFVEVQPEGKKRMSGADWANGARMAIGDCLSQ